MKTLLLILPTLLFSLNVFPQTNSKNKIDDTEKSIHIYYEFDGDRGPTYNNTEVREFYKEGPNLKGIFKIYGNSDADPSHWKEITLAEEEIKANVFFKMLNDGKEIMISPIIDYKPFEYEYGNNHPKTFYYKFEIPVSSLSPGEYNFHIESKTDRKLIHGYKNGHSAYEDGYKLTKIKIKEAKTDEEKDEALWKHYSSDIDWKDRHGMAKRHIKLLYEYLDGKLKTDKYRRYVLEAMSSNNAMLSKPEEAFPWFLLGMRYADNDNYYNTGALWLYRLFEIIDGKDYELFNNKLDDCIEKAKGIENKYFSDLKPFKEWDEIKKDVIKWCEDIKKVHAERLNEEEEYKAMKQMIDNHDDTNYQELIEFTIGKDSGKKVDLAYDKLIDILKTTKNQDVKKVLSDYLMNGCKKRHDPAFSFKASTYLSDDIKDDLVKKMMVSIYGRIKDRGGADWQVDDQVDDYEKQVKNLSLGVLKEYFNMGSDTFPFGDFEFSFRAILARCGKKEHLEKSIEMGKYLSRNDPTMAFQIWSYIRQPETIDILKQYLSDENSKRNVEAMKYLSECLIGFPYDPKDKAQNDDIPKTIETSRQWMKENYNPRKINSNSVLIDGKIYDNIGKDSEGKTP